jgi:hypothetical protein
MDPSFVPPTSRLAKSAANAGGDLILPAKLKANVIAMFREILTLMIKIIPFAELESAILILDHSAI